MDFPITPKYFRLAGGNSGASGGIWARGPDLSYNSHDEEVGTRALQRSTAWQAARVDAPWSYAPAKRATESVALLNMVQGALYAVLALLAFSALGVCHKLADRLQCKPTAVNALLYGWSLVFSAMLLAMKPGLACPPPMYLQRFM